MNVRRLAALTGILVIAGIALHQARSADGPKADAKPAARAASDNFALKYAQVQLRLAELRYRKAQDMNRRVPQTLAKGVIDQFADDVRFAQAQVKIAQETGHADAYRLWIVRSELDLENRQVELQVATDSNQRIPGAYTPLDMERKRASVELARLRVERGKSLANGSSEERLQWQLEMTVEEINRAQEMVKLSIQNRLAEFF